MQSTSIEITLSHKAWRSYMSTSAPEENIICSTVPSGRVFSTSTNSSGSGSSSSWGLEGGSMTCVVLFFINL